MNLVLFDESLSNTSKMMRNWWSQLTNQNPDKSENDSPFCNRAEEIMIDQLSRESMHFQGY